jgi:hypothetical protein
MTNNETRDETDRISRILNNRIFSHIATVDVVAIHNRTWNETHNRTWNETHNATWGGLKLEMDKL